MPGTTPLAQCRSLSSLPALLTIALIAVPTQARAGEDAQPDGLAPKTELQKRDVTPARDAAQTHGNTAEIRATSAAEDLLIRKLTESFPDLSLEEMMAFCKRSNPEALEEYREVHRENPAAAEALLRQLAGRYGELQEVRAKRPEEYERLVKIDRMESRSRRLARRIRTLAKAVAEDDANRVVLEPDLDRAREELKNLLQRVFTSIQQNQLIEINRLEAELRELRRLVEEREANNQLILQRRFSQLTGESPPVPDSATSAPAGP